MVKKKKNKTSANLFNAHQLLFTSIKKGDLSGVLKAIEDGAEVEPTRMKAQFKRKKSPLFLAVKFENVNIIPALLEAKAKIDTDCISLAYEKKNYDMVHVLLSECKGTHLRGEWYVKAIDLRWLDVIELLADRKCPMDAEDKMGNTPLHRTIMWGDYSTSKLLLDARADVSCKNSNLETPLHLAIRRVPMLARFVIAEECPLNEKNRKGLQPLHLALIHDIIDVAKLLIESSCDVDLADKRGRTPLFLVLTASYTSHVHYSQVTLVKLLLKSKCTVDRSILETAIKNDASQVVPILLDLSDGLTELSGLVKLAHEYCPDVESILRQIEVQRALEDDNIQVFPPRIATVIARWTWKMEKLDRLRAQIEATVEVKMKEVSAKMKDKMKEASNLQQPKLAGKFGVKPALQGGSARRGKPAQQAALRGRPGRARSSGGNKTNAGTGRGRGRGRIGTYTAGRSRGNSRIQERGGRRGRYRSQGENRKNQSGYRGSSSSNPPSRISPRGDGLNEGSGVTLQFAKTMLYKSLTIPKPPVRSVYRALRTFERVKPPASLPDNTLKVAISSRAGSLVIRALLTAGAPLTFISIAEAVKRSRTDVLKIFFASDKFDVNIKGPDGNTLFDVARINGRSEVMQMLENVKK